MDTSETASRSRQHLSSAGDKVVSIATAADVGRTNRARVLQLLAEQGPLSRAELARRSKVPRGTMGSIVLSLQDSGWLQEEPSRPPADGIGKPARPLWFGPRAGLCGSITIRGTTVHAAVVNARGEILDRVEVALDREPSDSGTFDRMLMSATLPMLKPHRTELTGVGLVLPAAVARESGEVVASTPLPGLVGSHLASRLSEELDTEVFVDEDVTALALGERWFGAARLRDDFAALQIGDGIGAGVMIGGHLLRPQVGYSEIGHTCVDVDGLPCRCGLRGCWETIASNSWLARTAAEDGAGAVTVAALVDLAGKQQVAAKIIHQYAVNIAVGIANLAQFLGLRWFILHGDVIGGGEHLRGLIESAVRDHVSGAPAGTRPVEVMFAEDSLTPCLLGAAALVLSRTLQLQI